MQQNHSSASAESPAYWKITSTSHRSDPVLKELLSHKDLFNGLVRRSLLGAYQQTLLGPFWIILQPLITVGIYLLIFHRVMGFNTANRPPVLFFLTGVILWNLFTDVLLSTSSIVNRNAAVFSKVYFPRIIPVFADNAVNLVRLGVQLLLLIAVVIIYHDDYDFDAAKLWLSVPAILCINAIALGAGMLLSLATVRYRDLNNLLQIGVRLLLFLCPVFYSLPQVPAQYRYLIEYNPLAPPFEWFRMAIINSGNADSLASAITVIFSIVIFISGLNAYKRYTANLIEIV